MIQNTRQRKGKIQVELALAFKPGRSTKRNENDGLVTVIDMSRTNPFLVAAYVLLAFIWALPYFVIIPANVNLNVSVVLILYIAAHRSLR